MANKYDAVIVGAGLSGCVLAERIANELNKKILLIDRRNHIAGNCYDSYMNNGVLVHRYGPHYFRTNKLELIDYLSNFTSWIDGNYVVKSLYEGKLYPFPINLDTLEQFFQRPLTIDTAQKLLEEQREHIAQPKNSEEFVLSQVGQRLYKAFYLNYTTKQWGKHPRELSASVCGRIPIRLNRYNHYVDHQFQIMPANGYTVMVQRMIDHPNIDLRLNIDFKKINMADIPMTIYTGAIDEYFNNCYGPLPWRSLKFKYRNIEQEYVQPCVQINYPNEHEYTRTIEIKHVTGQKNPQTTLIYEYPSVEGEPYYPVPTLENRLLYEKYKSLAEKENFEKNVYFTGRLAQYAYFNMDEVIEEALNVFEKVKKSESEK